MEKNSPTRSVERALDILDCFLDQEELILLEIAEKTGLSSSTVLRILNALQAHNYVNRNNSDKSYHLGSKISWLADHVPQESYDRIKSIAIPQMLELNEMYNEDVRLYVPVGKYKMCVETVESKRELRQVINVGTKVDLVKGAAGKVILAYMNASDRKRILNGEVNEDLYEAVRRDGYALSYGEREEGLFGMAVPILNGQNRLIATITMSGPSVRFDNEGLDDKIRNITRMAQIVTAKWIDQESR